MVKIGVLVRENLIISTDPGTATVSSTVWCMHVPAMNSYEEKEIQGVGVIQGVGEVETWRIQKSSTELGEATRLKTCKDADYFRATDKLPKGGSDDNGNNTYTNTCLLMSARIPKEVEPMPGVRELHKQYQLTKGEDKMVDL